MTAIRPKLILEFFEKASKRLFGDWVLLGGSVLPALGEDIRDTIDIDLAARGEMKNIPTLDFMKVAEEIGLPVEAINSAADFFLKKIPKYEEHLILLFERKGFRVFRPDVYLYVQLKLP